MFRLLEGMYCFDLQGDTFLRKVGTFSQYTVQENRATILVYVLIKEPSTSVALLSGRHAASIKPIRASGKALPLQASTGP